MGGVWNWLIDPAHASVVGALGLIIAIVGFPLTLIQLWRTKRAADAAKEAADNAKIRMNSFSATRECETARAHARSVNDAISKMDWDAALISYQDVAVSLMHLQQSNMNFDSEVIDSIDESLRVTSDNCNIIERAIKSDVSKLTKGKQFAALRPIDQVIAKILFNIERISA